MDSPDPAPRRTTPPIPAPWRWFLRISGLVALLLFLVPTVYVVKYYARDLPNERARAGKVSIAPLAPSVPLDALAPPLAPPLPGNAAVFYTQAIQSFADRRRRTPHLLLPTPQEAELILAGGRRRDCRFFAVDRSGRPLFVFRDPERGGQAQPYAFPRSPREPLHYLGAAVGLAAALARLANTPERRRLLGPAIIRFGDGLGREGATRTHLAVALIVQRIGLRLLLPGGPALKRYVYAQQAFADRVQAKYALLEPNTPDNLLLQTQVARNDPSPLWRREAVWALAETAGRPGLALRRPLDSLRAKAALAETATADPDPSVRAAASLALGALAQHGAVIRR